MFFSDCFLMEVLCAVVLHVGGIGIEFLQLKTVVQYSAASEVLIANLMSCIDSDL